MAQPISPTVYEVISCPTWDYRREEHSHQREHCNRRESGGAKTAGEGKKGSSAREAGPEIQPSSQADDTKSKESSTYFTPLWNVKKRHILVELETALDRSVAVIRRERLGVPEIGRFRSLVKQFLTRTHIPIVQQRSSEQPSTSHQQGESTSKESKKAKKKEKREKRRHSRQRSPSRHHHQNHHHKHGKKGRHSKREGRH